MTSSEFRSSPDNVAASTWGRQRQGDFGWQDARSDPTDFRASARAAQHGLFGAAVLAPSDFNWQQEADVRAAAFRAQQQFPHDGHRSATARTTPINRFD